MARWQVAFALCALLMACTRGGKEKVPGVPQGLESRVLNRDSEALCLQASTASCVPFVPRLAAASLGECCRVKCRAGSRESCQAFLENSAVTTPEYWNWPQAMELSWGERLGVVAPDELVEYLAVEAGRSVAQARPGDDPDFRKDLLKAWKELPARELEEASRLLIGVTEIKNLGAPVRALSVRRAGKVVAGVLALDWGTALQPVNEWAKAPLEPTPRNHRRQTLVWLLRIGIARLAGRQEPWPHPR